MAKKRAEERKLETEYYSASGPDVDHCAYLGMRYDADHGYKPRESECWILSHRPLNSGDTGMTMHHGTTGWLTGLWRSPSGAVFVSNMTDSKVLFHPDLEGDPKRKFEETKLGAPLDGVWGLDDTFVLTWGATFEGKRFIFRFDGKKWKELPAPDFDVIAIHGLDPELLYAVGSGGGVARWEGRAWKRFPAPTDESLNSVFVAGPDEVYATGGAGTLLEGSAHGWGKIAEGPVKGMPLLAVAKWKKDLWVAGGQFGLFKRVGTQNKLKCIKPNMRAVDFDTRGNLLVACEDFIGQTVDGKEFDGAGDDFLLEERAGKKLGEW